MKTIAIWATALARLFLAAGFAGFCLAAPAWAQEGGGDSITATRAPPAEQMAVTPGGVDMRTGRYSYSQTDLSIGEHNETGGLALTRGLGTDSAGHINPFGNFSHNFDIFLEQRHIDILGGKYNTGTGPDFRIRVHFGGRSETFDRKAADGTFDQISRSAYARLTWSGDVYTFTTSDGTVAVFRPITSGDCSTIWSCAFVSTITYADGTRFAFDYDAPGSQGTAHLRAVTSNRGYALVFQYGSGSDANFIASACVVNLSIAPAPASHACPASPLASASYSYTTVGGDRRLASAVDAAGATWSFAYTSITGGITMAFTRPGETSPWLTNSIWLRPTMDTVDEVVSSQAFADGSTYSYYYDTSPEVDGEIPQIAGGHYVDPAGHTVTIRYDFPRRPASMNPPRSTIEGTAWVHLGDVIYQITPGPVEITDALGRVTTVDYCDPTAMAGLPSSEHNRCLVTPVPVAHTVPGGQRTELSWDFSTRNLLQSRRIAAGGTLPDIVTSATYSCTPSTMAICSKPTSTTDARGNVTNFVYDTTHGGVLTETGPAPTAGAPRPETRHEYAQRYAWLANGSGGYVQAATPIWVQTATSLCRTSAATGNPCATAGDEVRTTYDYGPDSGPNTLLLRGQTVTSTDNGVTTTLRTCYGYDALGRRISETQPGANLGSCP